MVQDDLQTPARDANVHLNHVTKRFGGLVAVDDLTLDVYAGEFFSLLGPSGCGKTTTLRMIGGFEEPTTGQVYLSGRDETLAPPYRRDVNTVFQSYALFPHLTVFKNVAYGLRRRKVSAAEIKRRVTEILALVDLSELSQRRPSQLSGGQQQRVALARALVNRPKVLLLDEPMGALDAKLRKQMQVELKRIQREVGITFIYVTHDQEEALNMSDRIAVMRYGKVQALGPPQAMYEDPPTEFVAGFLGASNLLDGTVEEASGDWLQISVPDAISVRVPRGRVHTDAVTGPVKVGVRPEKLRLTSPQAKVSSDSNCISAEVTFSSYTGVGYQYGVRTPSGQNLVAYVQDVGEQRIPSAGDRVLLEWRAEHTFVVAPSAPLEDGEQRL